MDSDTEPESARRERPWLYAWNRRLRHLQGVSIRNLVVTPPATRARGKTIDDDDIPNTLKSASKLLSQNENHPLHPSKSFTDLKSQSHANKDSNANKEPAMRPRRRSTLFWNDPNPRTRQVKLEDIVNSRMVDSFFSLHCEGIEEPVYISEVAERANNPSFRAFDLNLCGPQVSRMDRLTIKIWSKTAEVPEHILLVEMQVHLRSLQFLGKTLESFHQPLPANSILFHFSDGVYSNLTDLPPIETSLQATGQKVTAGGATLPSSSYDALMKLANLDECVQDALATREKLEAQISSILQQNECSLNTASAAAESLEKLTLTKNYVAMERKRVRAAVKHKEDLIASIKARKEAMEQGRTSQTKINSHLPEAQERLVSSEHLLNQSAEEIKGQTRRIAEDLLIVYPIEPIPNEPLAFTIAGLALPNSCFEDIDREVVAAALGHTAHLVYLLSFYLSAALPYPVNANGSTSFIQDPISASLSARTYPLYPVSVQYRFEYAVFLLNKDIEYLLSKIGLRVLDIRHTLPNLKYLLYVLTAGTSEIPARKAGGVRALIGRLTPDHSRRGSMDSAASGEVVQPRKAWESVSKMNVSLASDKARKSLSAIG
ncbi:unnamed protein product [Penicillium salamii]|uniref:UV radiation resistance protein n=1 Tax=Penicillium salamii TaxID=1612424 RepID=A0A9W4JQL8_9EURO|nr:unnamed protein product [Penicillium salamii]